jgi:hypothetical protein
MKLKNLIKKLIEANPNADQEVFIELWEDSGWHGYKSLKIPIKDVDWDFDTGDTFDKTKSIQGRIEDLVLRGRVNKAFFNRWEKRKWYPVNVPSGMESYFPIKQKIKLTLPKETEK